MGKNQLEPSGEKKFGGKSFCFWKSKIPAVEILRLRLVSTFRRFDVLEGGRMIRSIGTQGMTVSPRIVIYHG